MESVFSMLKVDHLDPLIVGIGVFMFVGFILSIIWIVRGDLTPSDED